MRAPRKRSQKKDTALGVTFAAEVARMGMPASTNLRGLIDEHRARAATEVLRLISHNHPGLDLAVVDWADDPKRRLDVVIRPLDAA